MAKLETGHLTRHCNMARMATGGDNSCRDRDDIADDAPRRLVGFDILAEQIAVKPDENNPCPDWDDLTDDDLGDALAL